MKKEKISLSNLFNPDFLAEKAEELSEKADNISLKFDKYDTSPNPFKHWRRDRRIAKRENNKKSKK